MTKRNLKITITPEQPLDDVVMELERMEMWWKISKDIIFSWDADGKQNILRFCKVPSGDYKLTTLTELKEME